MDTLGDLTQILANLIIILGVLTWYVEFTDSHRKLGNIKTSFFNELHKLC